jgi:hypothetical protein
MYRKPAAPRLSFTAARTSRLALALVLPLVFATCNPTSTGLPGSAVSAPALAQTVLAALERRDVTSMRAAALNEQEFRDEVWPELPAARPERNLPFSYVWGELRQKSEAGLAQTLASQGGQHYELIAVRFLDDTTQYKTYLVHRNAELTVKDAAGAQTQLRVFGSVLEKNGRFKVFSYVVD